MAKTDLSFDRFAMRFLERFNQSRSDDQADFHGQQTLSSKLCGIVVKNFARTLQIHAKPGWCESIERIQK